MSTVFQQDKAASIKQAVELMVHRITDALTTEITSLSIIKNNICRLSIEIPDQQLLPWLIARNSSLKTYWSGRNNKFEMAGIDAADYITNGNDLQHTKLFSQLHKRLESTHNNIRYFGGFKFALNQSDEKYWAPFGLCYFVLPRFELCKLSDKTYFVCNLLIDEDNSKLPLILSQLKAINFQGKTDTEKIPKIISRKDFPSKENWSDAVNLSLDAFKSNRYNKIVLARKTSLTFSGQLNPLAILRMLKEKTSNCYHFCFQPQDSLAFIGATPEMLYNRQGRKLQCEALAGTRPRGNNETLDNKYSDELLNSEKDIREHSYVIDSLVKAFNNLADPPLKKTDNSLSLLKLTRVQHLITRYKLKLKDNVTDKELLNALHPTAAVGGYPKENIIDEISRLENFDRGWYAAPVGWLGHNTAEFVVAIRSGLVKDNFLNLYSGAGIIDGSTADSEWNELENKISNFLKVLS